jgi:protein-S-isoprenylcysteine O-methyltransferase Ste14
MYFLLNFFVPGLWFLLLGVWGFTALRGKKTQQSENLGSRGIHLGLMGLSFLLTLTPWLRVGPLGARFVPSGLVFVLLGCLLEAVGIGFAIAARLHLGQNWSGTVTIKQDHQLIHDGPYALVRHPIYTGWLLAIIGSAIAYGEWGGLLGCALMLLAFWRKITIEEQFLIQQFGADYQAYRRQVKALIPLIW